MFDLHEWYLVKIYSTKPLITYRNLSKTFIREFILEILIERTILELEYFKISKLNSW